MAAVFVAGRGRLWAFGRVAAVRVRYGDRLVERWESGSLQKWAFQGADPNRRSSPAAQMQFSSGPEPVVADNVNESDGPRDPQSLRILDDGFSIDSRPDTGIPVAVEAYRPERTAIAMRAVAAFPRGGLLGGEAGAGPIVDVGLMIRSLLSSGKAKSFLLLVQQSALREWQHELYEKFNLQVPRLQRGTFYSHEDREMVWLSNPWGAFPVMLASSQLARRRDRRAELLAGGPWDVVVVGDAHEARRAGRMPQAVPNKLLALLQAMKSSHSWRALFLVSSTPAPLRLHEALEFMDLLGLTKMPADAADDLARYFTIPFKQRPEGDWEFLRQMCADHFREPAPVKALKRADGGLPRKQRSRRVRRHAAEKVLGTVAIGRAAEVQQ
jgi:hypothetical protein